MAYAPLPKLIPINCTKIYPKGTPKPTLSEVLQSDPVKRLFNQPNIVIETIPAGTVASSTAVLNKSIPIDKKNGTSQEVQIRTRPEVSILPVKLQSKESKEEVNLLPSKKEGKSEIALLPLKQEKKLCGHREPCENIVCHVAVHQYVDQNGVSPLLAVGIEDNEINAPVAKHCPNDKCDALSIDHNRCRRALIKLNRCDKSAVCDICGIKFKTRKSRYSHKNCVRKDVYRHNETDGAQVMKEKMREREFQMMQMSRTKRLEPTDPLTEYNRAMEVLKKNEELIIIPKSSPLQQPIITITSIPSNTQTNHQFSNVREVFGKLLPSIPIMFPQQQIVLGKRPGSEPSDPGPFKQAKISDIFPGVTVTPTTLATPQNQQQFIKVTRVTQPNFIQPLTLNDWFMSQAQIVGTTPNQPPRPFLTPIRVVPIANLKTPPSLLHQTQGIPRFCIMPDNSVNPTNIVKPQPIQPAPRITPDISIKLNIKSETEEKLKGQGKKPIPKSPLGHYQRRRSEERNGKTFMCSYCPKRFSTDWYFKMHVARHKGEMLFSCKICEQPFSNRYDMKKHMLNDHKEGEVRCEVCGQISLCNSALEIHMRSHTGERPFGCEDCNLSYRSSTDLKIHQRKRHGLTDCNYCHMQFTKVNLKTHLVSQHEMTEEQAELEVQQDQQTNGDLSSESTELGNDGSEAGLESMLNGTLEISIKDEPIDEIVEGMVDTFAMSNGELGDEGSERNGTDSVIDEHLVTVKPSRRRSSRRSESMIQCNICKEMFHTASSLQAHLATKPDAAVECRNCFSMFHTQNEFEKHSLGCKKSVAKTRDTKSRQQQLLPLQCEVCEETFSSTQDLHMHNNLKPAESCVRCDKCNKKFHTSREYDKHFYNFTCVVYKCRHCDRVFKYKKTLDTHITKIHRHMHKCTECDKQYTNRFNLRYHAKTSHNMTID